MRLLNILILCFCLTANAVPIEFVVYAGAGGPTDVLSRKIAAELTDKTGLEIVVLNKPGAAHVIAYNYIINSDKPTIFIAENSILANPVFGQVKILNELGTYSDLVFVAKNSRINSWDDMVNLSKKREINFGNGGVGTQGYKTMQKVCEKIACLSVPFKSGSDGMVAMLNGTIDAYSLVSYGAEPFLNNPNYKVVKKLTTTNGDNWIMLFGKNLPINEANDIVKVVSKMEKIK